MTMRPTPDRLVGVVGSPIAHSLSPLLHHAAFEAMGLNWASARFDVGAGGGASVLAAISTLGLRGVSVTMPLKAEIAGLVDVLDSSAAKTMSVNTISVDEGVITGTSTDGAGLFASLRRTMGLSPEGLRVLIAGAGGASRSLIAFLGSHGAREVAVVARAPEAARSAASLAGEVGRPAEPVEAPLFDLVINATPVGMSGTATATAAPLIDPTLLHADQVAVDLVYRPLRTPWLAAAEAAGARTEGGLGMLVHQAALALEVWTGHEAPIDDMLAAVEPIVAAGSW